MNNTYYDREEINALTKYILSQKDNGEYNKEDLKRFRAIQLKHRHKNQTQNFIKSKYILTIFLIILLIACKNLCKLQIKNNYSKDVENLNETTTIQRDIDYSNNIPKQYMDYLIDTTHVAALQNFNLIDFIALSTEKNIALTFIYQNEQNEMISINIVDYYSGINYPRTQNYPDGNGTNRTHKTIKYKDNEYELIYQTNLSGNKEYILLFYIENRIYYISDINDLQLLLDIGDQLHNYLIKEVFY